MELAWDPADRPKLRPYLAAYTEKGQTRVLHDQVRISNSYVRVGPVDWEILKRLNGEASVGQIHADIQERLGSGVVLPLARVAQFIAALDQALFLDTTRFHEVVAAPVRKPACIGCYEADPRAFQEQMKDLFQKWVGEVPGPSASDHNLKGLIVPHMDYARGNATYAHAYRELLKSTNARLFVILATSHYSDHPISLTRKDFQSPLGIISTDQKFIDILVENLNEWIFEDEIVAHFPEHSVELEAVLLHYLLHQVPGVRIVPVVLGASRILTKPGANFGAESVPARILRALKDAETRVNEPVCYLLSGDLAHIGPKFEDPIPLDASRLASSKEKDQAVCKALVSGSARDFLGEIVAERNQRNVCGVAPFWYGLNLMGPVQGNLLHYQQFVDPKGKESVSFAAVGYQ